MLEEEFVPYNLAKQIKQLGFKQECFGYYIDVEVPSPFLVKNIISDDQGGYFTLAPTFSQAFRWFREKYNLRHSVFEIEDKNKISGSIKGTRKNNFKHYGFIDFYDTDKEAELECLKKLIELCKNQ